MTECMYAWTDGWMDRWNAMKEGRHAYMNELMSYRMLQEKKT